MESQGASSERPSLGLRETLKGLVPSWCFWMYEDGHVFGCIILESKTKSDVFEKDSNGMI